MCGSNHRIELSESACSTSSSDLSPSPTRHFVASALCFPGVMRDACVRCGISAVEHLERGCPRAGGDDAASATPGAIVGIGTNQEREVKPPSITASTPSADILTMSALTSQDVSRDVSRDHLSQHYADPGNENAFDPWRAWGYGRHW